MKVSKNRVFLSLVATAAIVTLAAGAGMAQRQGGQPGQNRQGQGNMGGFNFAPAPIVKTAADGVYVLNNGTLIKYDTSLKEKGTVKLAEPPKPPADAQSQWMAPRLAPGALLIAGEKVIVVIGDQFFSVDSALSQTPVKVSLPSMQTPPPADASGQPARPQFGAMQPAPFLELQGQIVYVVRGLEIVGVDLTTNKVTGLASLPRPAAPAPPPGD